MINLKEYDGFLVDNDLNIYNSRTLRKLTPYKGSDGYIAVSRRSQTNKIHHNRLHVILAHCFIPNPNNYKYINHKDSNKLNNDLNNLEWCTNSENVYHGWHSGNRTHKNNTAVKVIDKNGNVIGKYSSIRKCSEALNMDRHKIARALKGELQAGYLNYYFSYI